MAAVFHSQCFPKCFLPKKTIQLLFCLSSIIWGAASFLWAEMWFHFLCFFKMWFICEKQWYRAVWTVTKRIDYPGDTHTHTTFRVGWLCASVCDWVWQNSGIFYFDLVSVDREYWQFFLFAWFAFCFCCLDYCCQMIIIIITILLMLTPFYVLDSSALFKRDRLLSHGENQFKSVLNKSFSWTQVRKCPNVEIYIQNTSTNEATDALCI